MISKDVHKDIQINHAIGLLKRGIGIYYTGDHTGAVLTREQGRKDAGTWADYINIGMEHGCFDVVGLAEYMIGLVGGGPSRFGKRTPPVVVEAPVNGASESEVRNNAWQFRQLLGRGIHGIVLCKAEDPLAVSAFVESCRFQHQTIGVDPELPPVMQRMVGARVKTRLGKIGPGTRGRGSERSAAFIWGISEQEYFRRCDPWPLNEVGELLLGAKIESPEGVANCDAICAIPGLSFAELGPGDLGMSLGYTTMFNDSYPPEIKDARDKVLAACRRNGISFLELSKRSNICQQLDDGVRIIAGLDEEAAEIGRNYQAKQ